jgi:hypothetical protein
MTGQERISRIVGPIFSKVDQLPEHSDFGIREHQTPL